MYQVSILSLKKNSVMYIPGSDQTPLLRAFNLYLKKGLTSEKINNVGETCLEKIVGR